MYYASIEIKIMLMARKDNTSCLTNIVPVEDKRVPTWYCKLNKIVKIASPCSRNHMTIYSNASIQTIARSVTCLGFARSAMRPEVSTPSL